MSWLTRISAPSLADSASICASRARSACVAPVRSSAMRALAPDDQVRLDPAEPAAGAELGGQRLARVGARRRVVDHARLDQRDRVRPRTGNGGVSAKASGPGPAATAKATAPAERPRQAAARPGPRRPPRRPAGRHRAGCGAGSDRPGGGGRRRRAASGRSAPSTSSSAALAISEGDADQPHAADGGEREHRRVLPLGGAVQVPRAAEPLVGAHPLGDQPAARHHDEARRAVRHHEAPGRSSLCTATANGDHIQPMTAPSSTRPGPISGAIQYSIAIR